MNLSRVPAVVVALILVVILFLATAYLRGEREAFGVSVPNALGAALTLTFVALGWAVQLGISVRQNTYKILLESRLSDVYQRQVRLVESKWPVGGDIITSDDLKSGLHLEEVAAQRYILNYLEIMAIGASTGDFHEATLRSFMRGMLIRAVGRSRVLIDHDKQVQPAAYFHLLRLHEKWSEGSS